MDDELAGFVALFNRGEFWESHELLETPWRASRDGFYKGLILYASAFVHAQRGNAHGVLAQLAKAEAELAPFRGVTRGIDVDRLLAHAERCRAIVGEHPQSSREELAALIPLIRIELPL